MDTGEKVQEIILEHPWRFIPCRYEQSLCHGAKVSRALLLTNEKPHCYQQQGFSIILATSELVVQVLWFVRTRPFLNGGLGQSNFDTVSA